MKTSAILVVSWVMVGCSQPVENASSDAGCAPLAAEAKVVWGNVVGDILTPFASGDTLHIIDGKQGGTWVMPGADLDGVGFAGTVSARVVLTTGETAGAVEDVAVHMFAASDGSGARLDYIPIPIGQTPGSLSASVLSGQKALLSMDYMDACERSAHGEVNVVLLYDGLNGG